MRKGRAIDDASTENPDAEPAVELLPDPGRFLRANVRFALVGLVGLALLCATAWALHLYRLANPVPESLLAKTPPELHHALYLEYGTAFSGHDWSEVIRRAAPEYRRVIETTDDPKTRFDACLRLTSLLNVGSGHSLEVAQLYERMYEISQGEGAWGLSPARCLSLAHYRFSKAGETDQAQRVIEKAREELEGKDREDFFETLKRRREWAASQPATQPAVEEDAGHGLVDAWGRAEELSPLRRALAPYAGAIAAAVVGVLAFALGRGRDRQGTGARYALAAVVLVCTVLTLRPLVVTPLWTRVLPFLGSFGFDFMWLLFMEVRTALAAAACFTDGAFILLALAWFLLLRRRDLRLLLFGTTSPLRALLWSVGSFVVFFVVFGALRALFRPEAMPEWTQLSVRGQSLSIWVVLAALQVVLVGPALEELLYRGLLQGALATRMPTFVAVILSTGVFLLGHAGYLAWTVGGAICISLMGLLAGVLYARTKGLFAPFLLHVAVSSIALVF